MIDSSLQVSIIVPTFRDWDRLLLCLSALTAQNFPKANYEILVANNDPSNPIPDQFNIPDNCRIFNVEKSGSYAARNAALSRAKGQIIGFTDSDCIPAGDWIANAVGFLELNSQYSRIAGKIELFYEGADLTSAELFEKVYAFKQDHVCEKLNSSVTGNMFAYKYVFEDVGNFDEDLYSGGDHEWSFRAQAKGYLIGYGADVIVKHPARSTMQQLIKKSKRVGGGKAFLTKSSKAAAALMLFKSIKPPLHELKYYLQRYGGDLTVQEKMKVSMIKYFLTYIERLEAFKLTFGKIGERE